MKILTKFVLCVTYSLTYMNVNANLLASMWHQPIQSVRAHPSQLGEKLSNYLLANVAGAPGSAKRGRKTSTISSDDDLSQNSAPESEPASEETTKAKRRRRTSTTASPEEDLSEASVPESESIHEETTKPKRRGRTTKPTTTSSDETSVDEETTKPKRQRKTTTTASPDESSESVSEETTKPKRRRRTSTTSSPETDYDSSESDLTATSEPESETSATKKRRRKITTGNPDSCEDEWGEIETTRRRKKRTVSTTLTTRPSRSRQVKYNESVERVIDYFTYVYQEKYKDFYQMFYKMVHDSDRNELRNYALKSSPLTRDYRKLRAHSSFPIPEMHERLFYLYKDLDNFVEYHSLTPRDRLNTTTATVPK